MKNRSVRACTVRNRSSSSGSNRAGSAAARLPGGHVEGFADTFGAVFTAIYDDVLAGAPSANPRYATFAAGHEEMLIGDAVLESSRTGAWVKVGRA